MDNDIINLLNICGIDISNNNLNGLLIEREILLSHSKYEKSQDILDKLRKKYSSSSLTSMQKNANNEQRWPLLNLVRQLLRVENYTMKPIRKADGYELDGKKKYKRFFIVGKEVNKSDNSNNNNENVTDNSTDNSTDNGTNNDNENDNENDNNNGDDNANDNN